MDTARLTLSYQRYALLVFAIVGGLGWGALHLAHPVGWGAAVVLGAPLVWFGTLVALRLPHKLRLTRTQDERIRRGKFRSEDLMPWVDDPCYRVVSREVLVRSGLTPAEARQRVARLRVEADTAQPVVFFSRSSESASSGSH